nr:pilus assembly protein TadG-related protein [Polycladospora coralii]
MKSKKGNVTTLWLAGLPMFALLMLALISMLTAWLSHSSMQVAADAASLAATKKMDKLVQDEINDRIARVIESNQYRPVDEQIIDPYYYVVGTKRKKERLIRYVINHHQSELIAEVKKYVKKNGASSEGVITFFVNGRIEVEARTPYSPALFEEELSEQFKDAYVKGRGTGPTRDYMKWITSKNKIKVSYD